MAVQPAHGGPIPRTQLKNGLGSWHGGHGIRGIITVAPEPKGMPQLVQGRGLEGFQALARTDDHLHPGLHLGRRAGIHLPEAEGGAPMAGARPARGIQPQGGTAPPVLVIQISTKNGL